MKPSDHVRVGECPYCHGHQRVNVLVPFEHDEICPLCYGTGGWPPPGDADDEPTEEKKGRTA